MIRVHDADVLVAELRAVKIAAAVDEDLHLRVVAINQIISPLVRSEDAAAGELRFRSRAGVHREQSLRELRPQPLTALSGEKRRSHRHYADRRHPGNSSSPRRSPRGMEAAAGI